MGTQIANLRAAPMNSRPTCQDKGGLEEPAWNQIVVFDPTGLSGDSVASILTQLSQIAGTAWVAITDPDWFGTEAFLPAPLSALPMVLELGDLVKRLRGVIQVTWAYFFLCSSGSDAGRLTPGDARANLALCRAAVRATDGWYFYVYLRDDLDEAGLRSVAAQLEERFGRLERKHGSIWELDFPY